MNMDGKKKIAIMPAFRMQEVLGLSSIGQNYVMPEGETMGSLELKFFEAFVANGNEATPKKEAVAWSYAKLLGSLNPEMAGTCPQEHEFAKNVAFIRGMASGYNKDDIEFFLHVPETIRQEIYDGQQKFLESAGLVFLGWAPSPKTFESIKEQLAAKYGPDWHLTRKAAYDGRVQAGNGSRLFIEVDLE